MDDKIKSFPFQQRKPNLYIPNIFMDMNFYFRAPLIGALISVAKLGIVEAQSFRPCYFCYGCSTVLDNVTQMKLGLLTRSSVRVSYDPGTFIG